MKVKKTHKNIKVTEARKTNYQKFKKQKVEKKNKFKNPICPGKVGHDQSL